MMLDAIMLWLSDWGAVVPILCLILTRNKKVMLRGLLAVILTFGISTAIKDIVMRPRPSVDDPSRLFGLIRSGQWSFPSMHSSMTFSLSTSTFLHERTLGWISIVFAALIAYSRVYLGVHYWSDILAGAVLGIVIAYAVDKGVTQFEKSNKKRKKKII